MANLTSLPPELRLCIFENCEDVYAARHLGRTNRLFRSTWLTFPNRICKPILRRTIPCYNLIPRLVKARRQNISFSSFNQILSHTLWIANHAEKACEVFRDYTIQRHIHVYGFLDFSGGHSNFSAGTSERNRFLRALYSLWYLAVIQFRWSFTTQRIPLAATIEVVKGISTADFCVLCETSRILLDQMRDSDRLKLGINAAPPGASSFWVRLPGQYRHVRPDPARFPWYTAALDLLQSIPLCFADSNRYDAKSVSGHRQGFGLFLDNGQRRLGWILDDGRPGP